MCFFVKKHIWFIRLWVQMSIWLLASLDFYLLFFVFNWALTFLYASHLCWLSPSNGWRPRVWYLACVIRPHVWPRYVFHWSLLKYPRMPDVLWNNICTPCWFVLSLPINLCRSSRVADTDKWAQPCLHVYSHQQISHCTCSFCLCFGMPGDKLCRSAIGNKSFALCSARWQVAS